MGLFSAAIVVLLVGITLLVLVRAQDAKRARRARGEPAQGDDH